MNNTKSSTKSVLASLTLEQLVSELEGILKFATPGIWGKGRTTHHTVTDSGYTIAEFHHASDAQFSDVMHNYAPDIIAHLKSLISLQKSTVLQVEKTNQPSS